MPSPSPAGQGDWSGHWNANGSWTPPGLGGSQPSIPSQAPNTYGQSSLQATQYGVAPGTPADSDVQSAQHPDWVLSHPSFGQAPGGATAVANQLSQQGASFQGRQATDLYNEGVNINPYMDRNAAARAQQQANLASLQAAAQGKAPSAANTQMGMGLDSSLANAYANSRANGPMGAAQAQNASVGGMNNVVAQGGAGRAGELNAAQNAYTNGLSGITTGDIAQQGLENSMGIKNAQQAQQVQAENARMQLAYGGMAEQTLEDQLAANTGTRTANMGYVTQNAIANFNNQQQTTNALVSAGTGAAAGGLQSYLNSQNNAEQPAEGEGGSG